MREPDRRRRVVIESVAPEVDCGRFPIKRIIGEDVTVEADIFADGHDVLSAVLRYRQDDEPRWSEIPMEPLVNDRWRASFTVTHIGRYRYTINGWVDRFKSWRRGVEKKAEAEQDISLELLVGAELLEQAAGRASGADIEALQQYAQTLRPTEQPSSNLLKLLLSDDLRSLLDKYPDRKHATTYTRELEVVVDRQKAAFSTWYEMFPRSCSGHPAQHGTFKDCEARLEYVASMGFDVLYLPPIHPIGRTHRKGANNAETSGPDDPGSPWAIGAHEGGHKAIHPQLGTLEDFHHLVNAARQYGIEVALDMAFSCTPDHPYVARHPEWFRHRPDGSIQYAENPPKKYQDIYPLDFDTDHWEKLWQEMRSIVVYWIDQGIRLFRVDNPHTKPFAFWEWLIQDIKRTYPEVIFLSEAFTRPKIMYRLAKLGFTQSYTYFAWRNTKAELTEYFTELTQTNVREFFRPSLWTNTPDILTEYLQLGGRPTFMTRLILAATLGANYGIYGPAFELCEDRAREPGSEEYLNSEKYEIKHWDLEASASLKDLIARVNQIRRDSPALHTDWSLSFHDVDNEQLLCYSKHTQDLSNVILVAVNLDPHHVQSGWVHVELDLLGLDSREPYQVHDLLTDARYLWQGATNYLELNPHVIPAHIFRVRRRTRTERDFDYYT